MKAGVYAEVCEDMTKTYFLQKLLHSIKHEITHLLQLDEFIIASS